MNSAKRRILRGLGRIFIGAAIITVAKSSSIQAASNHSLAEFNAGAATVLDCMDREVDAAMFHQPSKQSVDDGDGESDDPDSEMSNLVMANVHNSLNVREEPNEDSAKVGYMYADCGGEILEKKGDWTKIKSGNLVGWCSNEYLLMGEEAKELASSVGITLATVKADALRVRKEPSEDSGIWGLVAKGDSIEAIVDDSNEDWVAIDFEGEEGYISAEFVDINFSVDNGETLEEIKERERKEKEEKAKLIANLGPVAVGATDEQLLASLVYCESGNQTYEGMLAVASVVMNRVRSAAYPNTISGVIYASGQFTPALNGKVAAQLSIGIPQPCVQAAKEAISGKTNIGTATHFRRWTGQEGIVIGAHVFY